MIRKRILIIENSIDMTGALNLVLRTSTTLKDQYDFIFAIPIGSRAGQYIKKAGFPFFEIPMLQISRRWRSLLFYIPTLFMSVRHIKKIVRSENIALIHVNDFYDLIMPLWSALGTKLPYICYVNFVPNRFPRLLRKIWIASHRMFAAKIVAVSQFVLNQLPKDSKITYVENALPIDEYLLSQENKKNILLYPGNFIEGKGQNFALEAFASISERYPEWKLRFVGGDMGLKKNKDYRSYLEALSLALSVDKQVEWSGFSKTLSDEYQQSAVSLNFSLSESFSLTVQEAMFYGSPVIATKSGGPNEIIEDKVSGILVELEDVKAMTKAMALLMSDSQLRARIAKQAYASIRQKFSYEHTSGKLATIYFDTVGKSREIL